MNTVLLQAGKAGGISSKWGILLGSSSNGKMFSVRQSAIRNMFIRHFLTPPDRRTARPCPAHFGVGAVVGGGADLTLGKDVVRNTAEPSATRPPTSPQSS